jgi:hypothetical protein
VALRSPSGWYSWFVKVQSAQAGVVHESAEHSSRPAVVTIGVECSGFSVEAKQRFITEPKRRGLKTAVGCRQAAGLSLARVHHGSRASLHDCNGEACASLDKMVISGKTLWAMDTHISTESRCSGVQYVQCCNGVR